MTIIYNYCPKCGRRGRVNLVKDEATGLLEGEQRCLCGRLIVVTDGGHEKAGRGIMINF